MSPAKRDDVSGATMSRIEAMRKVLLILDKLGPIDRAVVLAAIQVMSKESA